MIEMIVLACLANNPSHCREHSLGAQEASIMQCVMYSQPSAAKWSEGHPKWTVRRVECRPVRGDIAI